jgi:serine/threonine protein kinase/tetratricopeptide (TPR) repeat protein
MSNSAPPSDTAPTEPNRIGHYELRDCIGRGGMGLVYRARDTKLDRQVAIKCLRTELFEAHYVERFKREALLLAKLNHPNIVQVYDFIEAPDQVALVMELVEGQNLHLHLREHIVTFSQRMRWLIEIAQGLAVAHDAGIIHRDLKAENILINQRKVAKITDLGIAKSQDFSATLTDHIAGSYCSMSPEQAMGEPLDFKSDLFSFGILAYQLLCGAHPFGDTNNKLQLMQRIISHPPTAPGKHNPDLPPEINALLGQLLSKDPQKRPDNTHWVAAQLEKLSHVQLANDFASDDTQALIPNGSAANHSYLKNTEINSATRTQEHPTFETRFIPVNTATKKSRWLPIKNYLAENKISVGVGLFSALILAALAVWQLQPKPPKYVAVIPPKLTAEGMQESQQELVKGAVYDAIQQSVIQLDGYYLIPREEIVDVNGDNETVLNATAADELIVTDIQCKIETCNIVWTRLISESDSNNRLIVARTLTDSFFAENTVNLFDSTHNMTQKIFDKKISVSTETLSTENTTTYIETNNRYRKEGASPDQIAELDTIDFSTSQTDQLQSLYREIALDLYYETSDEKYILGLKEKLNSRKLGKPTKQYLENLYHLQIAEKNFAAALDTTKKLEITGIDKAYLYNLEANIYLEKGDYDRAATLYKDAAKLHPNSIAFFNLSITHWYLGDYVSSLEYVNKTLELAPNLKKALRLKGAIALISGDITSAIDSFTAVKAQDTTDLLALNNLGLGYLLQSDYENANFVFTELINQAPKNTTYMLNKADTENILNNQDVARSIYKNITDVPFDISSRKDIRNLSQAYAQLGEHKKAIENLLILQKLDSSNLDTMYTAALVYTLAGDQISALIQIEKATDHGMHFIWFSFPWFDRLCQLNEFAVIMNKNGASHRCPIK